MTSSTITQLLTGEYIAHGRPIYVPVKSVVIGADITKHAGDLLNQCGAQGQALLVCDANTHHAQGAALAAVLGITAHNILILSNSIKADSATLEIIKSAAAMHDYIIAVGSGTINDLCKYASFQLHKPYIVFGTAPSMNGYGSANASITIAGYKTTLKAHLPLGIFLDLSVLSRAPLKLIQSGLGDSLCRSTAQADWLLSHILLNSSYTDVPFLLLKDIESDLFTNSAALVKRDLEVLNLLATTLVLSGFGMYLAGGSYPASQGEHMLAHTMEMAYGNLLPESYHGEQIGVTTLTMAKLQENILEKSNISISNKNIAAKSAALSKFFGSKLTEECMAEYQLKQAAINMVEIKSSNWIKASQAIAAIKLPYDFLLKTLTNASCPTTAEEIGWQPSQYQTAMNYAKFSRNRFTFLDLK